MSIRGNSRHTHMPALDGLRGIAVAGVVGFHLAPNAVRGGGWGVLIFFVLSGYLITGILLREIDTSGRIDQRSFYMRRALRLLPALFLMLAVYMALVLVAHTQLAVSERGALLGVALASIYVFNLVSFVSLHIPHALTALWTLSVEEQFYLAWPLALLAAQRTRLRKHLPVACAVTAVAFTAASVAVFAVLGVTAYYRTWTWVGSLMLGAFLATFTRERPYAPSRSLAAFAAATLLVGLLMPSWNGHLLAYAVTIPVLGVCTALLLARLTTDDSWWLARLLSTSGMRYLGTRSYGIYLWNLACLTVARELVEPGWLAATLALLATFAIVEASYRFVEQPALKLKDRLAKRSAAAPGRPAMAHAADR